MGDVLFDKKKVEIGQEQCTMRIGSEEVDDGSSMPGPVMIDSEDFSLRFDGKYIDKGWHWITTNSEK